MTQANDERAARKEYIFAAVRRRCSASPEPSWWLPWWCPCCSFSMSEAWATSSRPPYSRTTPAGTVPHQGSRRQQGQVCGESQHHAACAQRHEVLRLRQGGERRVAEPRVQPPDAGQLHQEGGSHDDRLRQERRESGVQSWQAISPTPCWLWTTVRDQLIDVIVGATFDNLQDTKKGSAGARQSPASRLRRGRQDDRPAQGARA